MANALIIENDGTVATLTLNRPDKRNALNEALLAELTAAFGALADKTPRAVVVTGAGNAFSAGVAIGGMSSMCSVQAKRRADAGHTRGALIESLACPVIAAVNGFALGGGCELALACDFIYAADVAKFGQPEVNLGVIAGFG